MRNATQAMKKLYNQALTSQNGYLIRTPPTEWAQSLDQVFLHIQFAQRHDIPGCINHQNLNITYKKDRFLLDAFCNEGDLKIKYILDIPLWGTIRPSKSFMTEESVGGILITLVKNPAPMRWQTLSIEEKPEHLKLWMEKHQYWMHRLEEFEGDEMWDYEGWDFLHEDYEPEEEIAWKKPITKNSKDKKLKNDGSTKKSQGSKGKNEKNGKKKTQ